MDRIRFATAISERRKNLGLTQADLGEKVYVSSKTISKWELGKSLPSVEYWDSLADALELSKEEFLTLFHSPETSPSTSELIKTTLDRSVTNVKWYKKYAALLVCVAAFLLILSTVLIIQYRQENRERLSAVAPYKIEKISDKETTFLYDPYHNDTDRATGLQNRVIVANTYLICSENISDPIKKGQFYNIEFTFINDNVIEEPTQRTVYANEVILVQQIIKTD
ncbi:helix-turn-helix domain-containing protein [Lachnospiraceae bacterium OttesenSCG-928-J05]|nr:helix-turn-helix domain-containing protein [Lachnospiraceae bacterium OttesenSCG-928-J05]